MEKLLILHGALGSKAQFDQMINVFSNRLDVYFLEFSGHGIQPFQKDFSVQQFTKELTAYISKNSLQGCHVFAYSMGGYIALYKELLDQGSFASIQTLATKFEWTPEIAEQEIKMLNPDKILQKVPVFAEDLEKRHNYWRQLLECTQALMVLLGQRPLLKKEQLQSITIPVTIMRGSLDKMVSETESRNFADALPGGKYLEIPDGKHPVEKYKSLELAKLIEERIFL